MHVHAYALANEQTVHPCTYIYTNTQQDIADNTCMYNYTIIATI